MNDWRPDTPSWIVTFCLIWIILAVSIVWAVCSAILWNVRLWSVRRLVETDLTSASLAVRAGPHEVVVGNSGITVVNVAKRAVALRASVAELGSMQFADSPERGRTICRIATVDGKTLDVAVAETDRVAWLMNFAHANGIKATFVSADQIQ